MIFKEKAVFNMIYHDCCDNPNKQPKSGKFLRGKPTSQASEPIARKENEQATRPKSF
jgi:hypothetical protein